MSRLEFGLVVALLSVAGCGTTEQGPPAARVTPALRSACPLETDGFIASRVLLFESLRDEGLTRLEVLVFVMAGCDEGMDVHAHYWNYEEQAAWDYYDYCTTCTTGIIDFVYR